MKEFSKYWEALTYAFRRYHPKKRKSMHIPYVIHPVRIASILRAAGFNEYDHEDMMLAALFHDLVEDTNTTLEEIEDLYGHKVASIVAELTKPDGMKGRDKDKWLKQFSKYSDQAKIIKMADRIDNLIDMGDFWTIKEQKSYAVQGKIILDQCGEAHSWLADKLEEVIEKILSI